MAFLKIKTVYVIGNDNGSSPPSTPLTPLNQTNLTPPTKTTATTVDLFIFGTAEPATAIMAASIPVLRTLIRRRENPKPARFIELGDTRLKVRSAGANKEGQGQQRSLTDPATATDKSMGRDEEEAEPGMPTVVTKVSYVETVCGDRGRDEEVGGMAREGGSTEQLTGGLGIVR